MAEKTFKTRIQLIRSNEATLREKNPATLTGEFYIIENNNNTGKFKFKVGKSGVNFTDLPYYEDNLLEQLGISVSDVSDGQILVYNGTSGNWENEKFVDTNELTYSTDKGLQIIGYDEATSGQMLVKDALLGLKWITPVSTEQLNQAVTNANAAATKANNSAVASASSASNASTSAIQAAQSVEQIQTWIGQKFWWGTLEEYNALTEIQEGTFYFVRME